MSNVKISCIVPCKDEEEALPIFLDAMADVAKSMTEDYEEVSSFEVLLIDDGSTDDTLDVMRNASAQAGKFFLSGGRQYMSVRYISFSRNFGKEAALYAGLRNATGDYVAVMDADMQDPPSMLPQMYEAVSREGYDNAATRRSTREGEPPVRSWFAHRFYELMNRISDSDIVDGARDFRLMNRRMVDAILSMSERNRFSKGIFGWVGFKTKWLDYENVERSAGETKWSFWSLFKYAIEGIVAFSTTPLSIAAVVGSLFAFVGFVATVIIIVRALLFGDPVAGWPSMAALITFFGGLQLMCLGIIGAYIARIYIEAKSRPLYIVAETEATTPADAIGEEPSGRDSHMHDESETVE